MKKFIVSRNNIEIKYEENTNTIFLVPCYSTIKYEFEIKTNKNFVTLLSEYDKNPNNFKIISYPTFNTIYIIDILNNIEFKYSSEKLIIELFEKYFKK